MTLTVSWSRIDGHYRVNPISGRAEVYDSFWLDWVDDPHENALKNNSTGGAHVSNDPDYSNLSDTDWASLNLATFGNAGEIWQYCQDAQRVAGQTGLIIAQVSNDFYNAMRHGAAEGPKSTMAKYKARKAATPFRKILNHMEGIRVEFGKLPKAVESAFIHEIEASKGRHEKRIDWSK